MFPIATSASLPDRFPSPFDRGAVHPLASDAAKATIAHLNATPDVAAALAEPGGGKMFGVLVVQTAAGAVGYLRAFSGMLCGAWFREGWAPPTFDASAHDRIWGPGDIEMRARSTERAALAASSGAASAAALARLDTARAERSRTLLVGIQNTYQFTNALGNLRSLRDIFAPAEPPGGAGDCAAPKLLAYAYRMNLRPVALAEFWWGAPPKSGDRRAGSFYPACHGKCGPILSHMLGGLRADPPPVFGAARIDAAEPRVVYEDEWLLIVDKPCGLLSVPGRSAQLQDCVLTRLRTRYPAATGPLLVHRLDLDTSGLLLAAKDSATYAALQRLFAQREIAKRYVAWVEGGVRGDSGTIDLPLRLDIDDRPRHIHDPQFGKRAITSWQVLQRLHSRTKVLLMPHTGRTHQLRVHAAHPDGLDAPILGDRLYGRAAPSDDERLLLHAESLTFLHPATGQTVHIERPSPF